MSPMHRRQFLTFAAGTTGAVALAGVLSACGGGSAGQDSTSGSTDDAGTTALISIGNSEGDPANLDTGMQNTFANLSTVGSACHAYLLYLGADGSLEGDLATGFESESDTRIRFDLREGVTFHNGRAMTAQDVVDSFERLMNPDGGSPYAALLSPIETIEVVDDLTVAFTLNRPYAPLTALCSQIPIIPIETADQQATAPVGAGPFQFSAWETDNYMAFTRFEDYYNQDYPKVEEIRFLPRADATALRSGFQAAETNAIAGFAWPEMEALGALPGATVGTSYINGFNFISFNCRVAPFDDVRVRKAFSLALDRELMAQAENGPDASPAHVLIAATSPYFPADLQAPFDPTEARALLAEAGIPEGFEVEALIPDLPLLRPLEPVWQSLMADVGITLTTRLLPPADYVARVFTNFDFSLGIAGDSSAPDPALFLDRYLMTEGANNHMGYSNTELDALLSEASATFDEAARADLYRQAMEIVVEEAPIMPFIQIPVNTAAYEDAAGFTVRPNYLFEVRDAGR
ncbi:ABC transporter substrate-binding protein [Pseudactinotalea suaedae]|uniref:ABC transporter substrate-binding protein n=1 Tax=Pseudactinotalea suaedae TaxID=1524924 RepID=UPI0012E0FCDB|nr:ABC transporter substrate-binding protein [Pseudactinotalea suaedae]